MRTASNDGTANDRAARTAVSLSSGITPDTPPCTDQSDPVRDCKIIKTLAARPAEVAQSLKTNSGRLAKTAKAPRRLKAGGAIFHGASKIYY
jgi:hypothetical protein